MGIRVCVCVCEFLDTLTVRKQPPVLFLSQFGNQQESLPSELVTVFQTSQFVQMGKSASLPSSRVKTALGPEG